MSEISQLQGDGGSKAVAELLQGPATPVPWRAHRRGQAFPVWERRVQMQTRVRICLLRVTGGNAGGRAAGPAHRREGRTTHMS